MRENILIIMISLGLGVIASWGIVNLLSIQIESTNLDTLRSLEDGGGASLMLCENYSRTFNVDISKVMGEKKDLFAPICEVPTSVTECVSWKMVTIQNRPLFAFSFAGDFIPFRGDGKFVNDEGFPVGEELDQAEMKIPVFTMTDVEATFAMKYLARLAVPGDAPIYFNEIDKGDVLIYEIGLSNKVDFVIEPRPLGKTISFICTNMTAKSIAQRMASELGMKYNYTNGVIQLRLEK